MNNRILLLLCAAAVCAAALATMSALTHKAGTRSAPLLQASAVIASEHNDVKPDGLARTDERAQMVSEVLRRMKAKAKGEISPRILSNTGDFLVALDAALSSDTGAAGGGLPLLYLIDKAHSVGRDYVPASLVSLDAKGKHYTTSRAGLSLRAEAEAALEKMAQAAAKDGVTLMASSTYRSYDYQKTVYDKWVRIDGQEEADRESARPGTSQHQLGCAVDFGSITDDFDETKMGRWMYAHGADWGWSLSFPRGREDVTGYRWECWHFRYIGREACRLQDEWFCGVQQYMMEFIDIWRGELGALPQRQTKSLATGKREGAV